VKMLDTGYLMLDYNHLMYNAILVYLSSIEHLASVAVRRPIFPRHG
jgi:hypothetical protein